MTEESQAGAAAPEPEQAAVAKAERKRVASNFSATQMEGMKGLTFAPRNFEEVWFLANVFASAGEMVPKVYRGSPEACSMAIMWGLELGISPIQAIQGIAVIGGRAAVWGDLQHALIVTHPEFEAIDESLNMDDADAGLMAVCKVTRKGFEPIERTFSMRDAIRAGLVTKETYKSYPQRMLQMRARSWAERDALPHALKGLASADEMVDVTERGTDRTVPPVQRETGVVMPRALEHQAPDELLSAVADVRRVAGEFADLESDFAPRGDPAISPDEHKRRVMDATPSQAALLGDAETETAVAHAESTFPPRKLSTGERALFDAMLESVKGEVTEQDVIDELGDAVNGANVQRAISLVTSIAEKRRAG